MLTSMLLLTQVTWAYNPTWEELYKPDDWVKQSVHSSDIGDIVVYKKMIDGFPCFQGETTASLPIPMMLEVAADAPSAVEWSTAGVKEGIELARTELYVDYYQYLDVPVFSDRYWVLRGYFEKDGAIHLFRWEKLVNGGPHSNFHKSIQEQYPDAEEALINIGAWIFTPTDQNVIQIQYRLCSHPGGSVPAVLQSIATEQSLPNNLRDMIQETQRRIKN